MQDIYFLVDLTKLSGFGHFMRSFVIADILRSKKYQIFYVSNYINLEIKNYLNKKKIKTLNYIKFKNLKVINKLIFIDDYKIKNQFIKILSNNNYIVTFNDNLKKYSKNANLIINNNLNFYEKKIKKKPNNLLIGSKYLLLRKHISEQKINKKIKDLPVNIYLSLGGSIEKEKLFRLLKNLKEVKYLRENEINFYININKYYREIKKIFSENSNIRIKFVSLKIDNHFDFNKIDFSINGGGLTSTEMLYLKIPQITICLSNNQRVNADFIEKKNIGLVFNEKVLKDKINLNKKFLIFLKKYRNIKSRLLKTNYIDNLGTKRILSNIIYLNK